MLPKTTMTVVTAFRITVIIVVIIIIIVIIRHGQSTDRPTDRHGVNLSRSGSEGELRLINKSTNCLFNYHLFPIFDIVF